MKTQHTPLRLAFRRPWPGTLRGAILFCFGLAFIFIGGINYIATPIPYPTSLYLKAPLSAEPQWVWGVMFIIAGALACFASYCHFGRDRWGYSLAAILTVVWGIVYASSSVAYDAGPRAVGAAVPWLLYSAILTLCARIPKVVFSFGEDRE